MESFELSYLQMHSLIWSHLIEIDSDDLNNICSACRQWCLEYSENCVDLIWNIK